MHILLGIIAAIGAVIFFVYRLSIAARAAREAGEAATGFFQRLRSFFRTRKYRKTAIDLVDDPIVAASAMMISMAALDGPITQAQKEAIEVELREIMGLDQETSENRYADGNFINRQEENIDELYRKMARLINQTCTDSEKSELVVMIEKIATLNGPMTPVKEATLSHSARRLSIKRG